MNTGWYMLIVLAVIVSGCARTEYKPYEEGGKASVNLYRTVNFYVNPALKETPPRCVLVLPSQGIGNPGFTSRIEKALVRHLSDKFPQVVSGLARDETVNNLAFDMAIPVDRRDFARAINCDTVFEYKISKPRHANMLFWSEIKIGLEARLIRQQDGLELWKARHVARRSDGGLSFSPIGIAVNAYDANALSSDKDIIDSVIEDLVRRLMKSMPNMEDTD